MKRGWWAGVVALGVGLGAAFAAGGEGGLEEFSAVGFFLQDAAAMQRAAEAFYGELGVAGDQEDEGDERKRAAEFFVLRGSEVDALSPDLQGALGGRRAVCVGQYRSGGVWHRALYSLDEPPVRLGVFRLVAGGRWAECPDGMPVPDAAAEKKEGAGETAAVPVRVQKRRLPGPMCDFVWNCLEITKDWLWR